MSVNDARYAALAATYGATAATATTNDLLVRWRADNGISTGDSERDYIMGFYPGLSYADARLQFWLDGGGFIHDPALLLLEGEAVFWIDSRAAQTGVNPANAAVQRLLRRATFFISSTGAA